MPGTNPITAFVSQHKHGVLTGQILDGNCDIIWSKRFVDDPMYWIGPTSRLSSCVFLFGCDGPSWAMTAPIAAAAKVWMIEYKKSRGAE